MKEEKNSSSRAWFTGNVLLLGLVSFFADISGEMMTPILPLYIAALGGSTVVIGFIGGFGDAVANIVKVFSGYLADKTGRRKHLIAIGYGIPFFAKLGIGLANAWEQIVVLKPTERLGKGIRGAPRDSLIADSISFEERGKAFGFHRMMDTAGAIIGSFLALIIVILLYDVLNDELGILKLILIISALVSLLAVIPILFLTEPRDVGLTEKRKRASLFENLKELPRNYYKFLLVSSFFGLANFTILLFIIHTKTLLIIVEPNIPQLLLLAFPIATFIWFNIVYTVLSIPFGIWSDKYGRKSIFAVGIGLFSFTCFGFALNTDPLIIFLLFGIYGAFHAATDGIQKALAVDVLPPDLKGTGIGLLQTVIGFAGIFGGIIAGYLYDTLPTLDLPSSYAFLYAGILSAFTLLLLYGMKIKIQNPIEK